MNGADYFEVDAISASRLKLIDPELGGYPKKYKEGFKPETERKKALEMGDALHRMLLEPEKITFAEFERPTENMILWAETLYAGVKNEIYDDNDIITAWKASGVYSTRKDPVKLIEMFKSQGGNDWVRYLHKQSKYEVVLTKKEYDDIQAATAAVKIHPKYSTIFQSPDTFVFEEREVYFKLNDEDAKAKIDIIKGMPKRNLIRITDLKTTSQYSPYRISQYANRWKVARQLAFYEYAVREDMRQFPDLYQGMDPDYVQFEHFICLVSLLEPYPAVMGKLDPEWVDLSKHEIADLVNRIKAAKTTDASFEELQYDFILPISKPV